jgi:hypothetical protein
VLDTRQLEVRGLQLDADLLTRLADARGVKRLAGLDVGDAHGEFDAGAEARPSRIRR